MMKIYTKIGDKGKTSFFGCELVEKIDPRIETFGAIDELNSVIGITLCFVEDSRLRDILIKIQNDIFTVGADLAGSEVPADVLPRITNTHVKEIEVMIDKIEEKIGLPDKFILPGGTISSSFLHLCRAITRRAERTLVGLKQKVEINPIVLQYTNRLSDLFYILARHANNELDVKEQQPIYKYFKEEEKEE